MVYRNLSFVLLADSLPKSKFFEQTLNSNAWLQKIEWQHIHCIVEKNGNHLKTTEISSMKELLMTI